MEFRRFLHAIVLLPAQIRILAVELPTGKAPELLVEFLVESTHRALEMCPQSSSLIALTSRVDTPWMYISVKAATSAFSLKTSRFTLVPLLDMPPALTPP